jgi:hypothetical protein
LNYLILLTVGRHAQGLPLFSSHLNYNITINSF